MKQRVQAVVLGDGEVIYYLTDATGSVREVRQVGWTWPDPDVPGGHAFRVFIPHEPPPHEHSQPLYAFADDA